MSELSSSCDKWSLFPQEISLIRWISLLDFYMIHRVERPAITHKRTEAHCSHFRSRGVLTVTGFSPKTLRAHERVYHAQLCRRQIIILFHMILFNELESQSDLFVFKQSDLLVRWASMVCGLALITCVWSKFTCNTTRRNLLHDAVFGRLKMLFAEASQRTIPEAMRVVTKNCELTLFEGQNVAETLKRH